MKPTKPASDPGPLGAGVGSRSDPGPSGAGVGSRSDPGPLAIQARQPQIVVWHKKILFWNLKVFFEMVEVELGSFTPNGY
jgi:hypothetical protein